MIDLLSSGGARNGYEPQDPMFSSLWGLHGDGPHVNALRAWNITRGSRSVKIAVIDTGIDYNHEDLAANMWVNQAEVDGEPGVDNSDTGVADDIYGASFVGGVASGESIDDHNHGTHCAGTIGAVHNSVGVAGVMADVELVSVKFLLASGGGTLQGAIMAIDYATRIGASMTSNSWGGGGYSESLLEAIERANEAGILFVAAAGNDGRSNDSRPTYPASYNVDNVVSVASIADDFTRSNFSNFGQAVHVAAPGSRIQSTVIGNRYASYSGTSMATPHVAGVAGLIMARHPELSPSEIKERLIRTSRLHPNFTSVSLSGGYVDAFRALRNERNPIPDPHAWEEVALDEPFDFRNYENNADMSMEVAVPEGALFAKIKFDEFATEARYDSFSVSVNGDQVLSLSGNHENVERIVPLNGASSLVLRFTSDHSVTDTGAVLESIFYNSQLTTESL